MKRIIVTFFLISLSISLAFASPKIGDKINDVLYTDIITKINGQEVESFNINGRTAIYVKDAKKLGYEVLFNSDKRLVTIVNNEHLIPEYSNSKLDKNQFQKRNIGDKINDVLFTDIKTVINNKAVESFNINNSTAIYATALKNAGVDVTWLEDTRQVVISNIEKTNTTPKQAPDFGFSPEINDYLNREQDMSKVDESMISDWGKAEFRYLIKEINSEEDKKVLDLEYDLGEYTYDRYLPNSNQWHYGAEELSDEVDNYIISNIGKFRTMDGGGIDFFTESTRGNNGVFLHKLATQSHALRRKMRGLIDEPQDVLGKENIKILQKGDYPTTMIYTGGYYGGSGVNITVLNPNTTKKEGYDNALQIQWAGFGFENFVYMRAVFKQYFGIEEGERAYQILVNSYLKGDEYKDLEKFNFKKVYRFGDRNLAIVPNEAGRSGGIYFLISNPGNFNYVDYINKYNMPFGY